MYASTLRFYFKKYKILRFFPDRKYDGFCRMFHLNFQNAVDLMEN